jgi:hypothetical protein
MYNEIFCMQALWWTAACPNKQFHTCGNQMVKLVRVEPFRAKQNLKILLTDVMKFCNKF